jgi:hypothetical protein
MRPLTRYAAGLRWVTGLRGYLREPLTGDQCRVRLERQLATREEWLLRILEGAVFTNDRIPYRHLLDHAGIELGDVARLVREEGAEGTLCRLYDAGVYVTLDEFRGRRPISRPGLELSPVGLHDFDNPLMTRHFEARTSGSRTGGTRVNVDLDLLAHEAGYHHLFLSAFGLDDRPHAVWYPVPPGSAGMKCLLRQAKLGRGTERWFAHNTHSLRRANLKFAAFTASVVLGSRLWGQPLRKPEHVPLDEAVTVARWLAKKAATGAPALLETNWSSAVRVCAAARKNGLEIADTFFRVGGEAATEARSRAITDTGSRVASHYAMAEVSHVGIACAAPTVVDEVHVLSDKLAILQRPASVGGGLHSLHVTTLLPSSPKLMLNVDTGDCGVLGVRQCGCAIEKAGFATHLHSITSYEKLTSEGMSFLGSDVITLVDRVLPERFGGGPSDYQLVEEEEDALPRVSVLISPTVEDVDDQEVVATVLGTLSAAGEPQRMMAERWREGNTVRVVRRPPYAVQGAKVLPLHRIKTQA